jgi:hypothetical protein
VAFYFYTNGLAAGFPEAPADTVLTEGLDGQLSMAGFHGLLNLFFEKPGGQALSFLLPGYIENLPVFRHRVISGRCKPIIVQPAATGTISICRRF